MKPEPSENDKIVLEKSLSCSYPNMRFSEALQKENEKLKVELQRSQSNYDVKECEVIQRLIDMTEGAATKSSQLMSSPTPALKKVVLHSNPDAGLEKNHSCDGYSSRSGSVKILASNVVALDNFPLVLICHSLQ